MKVVTPDANSTSAHAGRTLKSAGFLAGGRVLGDAAYFLVFIALSHAFGPDGVGLYSFAIGLTGFLAVFAGLSFGSFAIKELSRRTADNLEFFGQIFTLQIILSVIVLILLLGLVLFLPFSDERRLVIGVIGLYQVGGQLGVGFTSLFIAREDSHLAGIFEFSLKVFSAIGVIALILSGAGLVVVLAALPIVVFIQLIITYMIVVMRYGRPRLLHSLASLLQVGHQSLPYAQSTILTQIGTRIDVVILGFLLGDATAGIYNVGYRAVFMLLFVPGLAAVALFPLAARLFTESRNELRKVYNSAINAVLLVGLPVSAGLWLISPELIPMLFGSDFVESVSVLRLLSALVLLTFFSRTTGVFLMSCDRETDRTKGHWIATTMNVVINLILIPTLGVQGAAIATLISESVLVLYFIIKLRPILGWPDITTRAGIALLGVASFFVPFILMPDISLILVVPASIILYCLVLLTFNETRTGEIKILMDLLKRT